MACHLFIKLIYTIQDKNGTWRRKYCQRNVMPDRILNNQFEVKGSSIPGTPHLIAFNKHDNNHRLHRAR